MSKATYVYVLYTKLQLYLITSGLVKYGILFKAIFELGYLTQVHIQKHNLNMKK